MHSYLYSALFLALLVGFAQTTHCFRGFCIYIYIYYTRQIERECTRRKENSYEDDRNDEVRKENRSNGYNYRKKAGE